MSSCLLMERCLTLLLRVVHSSFVWSPPRECVILCTAHCRSLAKICCDFLWPSFLGITLFVYLVTCCLFPISEDNSMAVHLLAPANNFISISVPALAFVTGLFPTQCRIYVRCGIPWYWVISPLFSRCLIVFYYYSLKVDWFEILSVYSQL